MVLKKENYIFIAVTTWGWTDDALIKEIFGFLPPDKESIMISGREGRILWSKTKLSNDTYYSAIDASVRLHKLCDELDFTVTNYGDIIIYRASNCSFTPQEVLDSYNRYISSGFFIGEENMENDMEKFNCIKRNSGRYDPTRLNTDGCPSLSSQTILTMPRNLGRSAAVSMLNSVYGLNPNFNGGLLNWNTWCYEFKLYFGVERATGKQKTVCLWKDGEKTVIRGDKSVLSMPVQYAVAWCYVKRRFKTTSQFKKYVDDHSFVMDSITYFEGDARVKGAQASTNNRTKKYDIYDAAALAITAKCYGSVKTIMNYCDGWGE